MSILTCYFIYPTIVRLYSFFLSFFFFTKGKEKEREWLKWRYGGFGVDAWGCRISSHVSLGRTESGKTGVSTGLSLLSSTLPPPGGIMERGGRSRDQREKGRKREAWPGTRGSRGGEGRSTERGGGAMAREPPPRRNDAALLSKIASQEKLRAKLPSPTSRATPPCGGPPSSLPPSLPSVTGRFLLVESIRWLQESGGFYC